MCNLTIEIRVEEKCAQCEGVVLLCGVPGAGKSHFAREFVNLLMERGERCHLLSFDDFEMPRDRWDETTFKSSRITALEKIKDTLEASNNDSVESVKLVVDDLMYLSSMRHEVYRLARDLNIPIAVIWVNTSLETCLRRNSTRDSDILVAPGAIRRIYESFEAPDPSLICDRVSYTVEEEGTDEDAKSSAERINATIWKDLSVRKRELVNSKENEENSEAARRESQAAGTSETDKLDQRLRKAVSMIMNRAPSEKKQELSKLLKNAKRAAMEAFKDKGRRDFPEALLAFERSALSSLSGQALITMVKQVMEEVY